MDNCIIDVEMVFMNQKDPTCRIKKMDCRPNKAEMCSPNPVCSMPASNACESSCARPMSNPCADVCTPHVDDGLGKMTRNPFFNFLRDFRKCHQNELATVVATRGAEKWNCMSDEEKSKYVVQAFRTPKKYYRRRSKSLMYEDD